MTRRALDLVAFLGATLALAGCDVPVPSPPHGAGIVDAALAPDSTTGVDGSAAPRCDRGVVVVEEPLTYDSTNVALVAESGKMIDSSIASSATASVGLSAPLSQDVVLPTMKVTGPEIVLVDQAAGSGRVIWVDIATAARRELRVDQGFYANPHDYVQVAATKSYVTRYRSNPTPGKQPFDTGGDVLVVDPSVPKIVASIDMTPALGADRARALPRPDRIVVSGSRAFVLLGALASDFSLTAPSRVVAIDTTTDAVTDVLTLDGFLDCAGLALSPTGTEVSVLCSGAIGQTTASDLVGSGIAVIDVRGPPRVTRTFDGKDLAAGPVGFFASYAAPGVLLFQTSGHFATTPTPDADDTVVRLDLTTGAKETELRSGGTPFSLLGIACDVRCGTCFVADAGRGAGVLHRFTLGTGGAIGPDETFPVPNEKQLPPQYVGRF